MGKLSLGVMMTLLVLGLLSGTYAAQRVVMMEEAYWSG